MSLTKEQVQHIATLARLEIAGQDFDDVADKLSKIVDFVDQLRFRLAKALLPDCGSIGHMPLLANRLYHGGILRMRTLPHHGEVNQFARESECGTSESTICANVSFGSAFTVPNPYGLGPE